MKRSMVKTNAGTGPTYIVLGPQGAGKGTQAELMTERFHLAHLETGAMLRKLASRPKTKFGRQVAAYLDQGKLVPFIWVLRLLEERIKATPKSQGIVIDGSPRRLPEALKLLALLKKYHRTVTRVFFVTVPKAETIRRLSLRWICTKCSRSLIMGKDVKKPTDACPYCGGSIKRRGDETTAAIARRLAIYAKETTPVIRHFRSKKLLVKINGKQPIKKVFGDIETVFKRDVQRHS